MEFGLCPLLGGYPFLRTSLIDVCCILWTTVTSYLYCCMILSVPEAVMDHWSAPGNLERLNVKRVGQRKPKLCRQLFADDANSRFSKWRAAERNVRGVVEVPLPPSLDQRQVGSGKMRLAKIMASQRIREDMDTLNGTRQRSASRINSEANITSAKSRVCPKGKPREKKNGVRKKNRGSRWKSKATIANGECKGAVSPSPSSQSPSHTSRSSSPSSQNSSLVSWSPSPFVLSSSDTDEGSEVKVGRPTRSRLAEPSVKQECVARQPLLKDFSIPIARLSLVVDAIDGGSSDDSSHMTSHTPSPLNADSADLDVIVID